MHTVSEKLMTHPVLFLHKSIHKIHVLLKTAFSLLSKVSITQHPYNNYNETYNLSVYSLERELTLKDFKMIFFWEYLHRMWGRSIGLVFALPAVYFLRKGYVSKAMKPRLAIYGTLLVGQVSRHTML